MVTNNSGIGDFLVGRDVLLVAELHGVGPNDVSDASHESSHLIGARDVPLFPGGWILAVSYTHLTLPTSFEV